jgi:hypothetical protein
MQEIIKAVDEAHHATASACAQPSASPQRREQATAAAEALRRYVALVAKAQGERRLTATAANLLIQDADNIIRGLQTL